MIKVSSLEKYGIKLDAKDELSQAFGQKVVTKFARRDMLMLYGLSPVDICVTVGNDIGHYNTEIEQIPATSVLPRVWTYWKPSMQWLVQQELAGYKDETDYFGEAVPVEIPTETPEEKEALDAIEKKSPYDVGAHVSDASSAGFLSRCVIMPTKPVYTQAMCDAGELPPVGSKFSPNENENDEQICLGYTSKNKVVGESVADGIVSMFFANEIKPIDTRTEREKAIEEITGEWPHACKSTIELMLDAGYTK